MQNQTKSSFVSKDSLPYSNNLRLSQLAEMSTKQVGSTKNIPTHGRGYSYDDTTFKRMHIGINNSQRKAIGGPKMSNRILENSRTGFPMDF